MKDRWVESLREGERVDSVFALAARDVHATRSGEAFLSMDLSDRTGRLPAVWFRPDRDACDLRAGCVVQVRGTVTSYRGERRVSVESMREVGGFDPADLLPVGRRDRDEQLGYLEYLIAEVGQPQLRAVLDAVFGDPDLLERFLVCPASRGTHHAYLGGLLEHTVQVATLCQHVGQLYPYVDSDLLLAAALLHDIGKVDEIEVGATISCTDEGRMVGHVVLGERRVAALLAAAGTPALLAIRMSHVLLSHHGELEWGSPRRPATLEALILHHVDNLDAKMGGFMDAVGRPAGEDRWTDAVNLFRRPLYVPRPVEDDRPAPVDEDTSVGAGRR